MTVSPDQNSGNASISGAFYQLPRPCQVYNQPDQGSGCEVVLQLPRNSKRLEMIKLVGKGLACSLRLRSIHAVAATMTMFHTHNPDRQLLSGVLEACRLSPNIKVADQAHARIIKVSYGAFPSLVSMLISVYVSCNCISLARQLLDEIPHWDFGVVSSNLIIASFMKVGDVKIAKRVFREMTTRDMVSWNSMIGGCIRNARWEEAFRIFRNMLSSNVEPDGFTFASVITGCARVAALDQAKWIHGLMTEKRIELNYILVSSLINMYSKCGRIETAKAIFDGAQRDNVSVWNAMINGLAMHGLALDAIATFSQMEMENILPDSITFIGILKACSHGGLVEQGRKCFDLMRTHYLINPQLEHYGSMVDLFGRAGLLDEAHGVIKEMPMKPDVVIWRAFLSACRTHKNPELAELAVGKISHLESGDYVLLSNIYCSVSKWDSSERVRNTMKKKGVRKSVGKSWIEFGGTIHQFKAGDRSHLETVAIYKVLEGLNFRIGKEGFVPLVDLVFMDISEEEKEANLNYHSEKLALAFGILKSVPGTEIRISKNLRTCLDCHSWIKMVSRLLRRVIIVRDRIRFHRFENGLCSCGEYW